MTLGLFGWRAEGGPPPVAKAVFIAAPHTSNWDLIFMLGLAWSLGLAPSWFGKHQLFRFPTSYFFRFLGGIPIDRRGSQNYVARSVQQFEQSDQLYLVIPPAGTRKKTAAWKSGFYHIARGADVPLCCGFLDYGRKVAGIGPTIELTGDAKADMDAVRAFYSKVTPLFPEKLSDIRLEIEDDSPPPV